MRWKAVCKSWYSLISTPCFVESHLKRLTNNNSQFNYKRITGEGTDCGFLRENRLFVVGSANGLVCVSPEDFQFLVVNPCTRQAIKILEPPPEPLLESDFRWDLVWGFGYDSSNDDYKIVVGLVMELMSTRFYVLSLKTCVWKFIQEYGSICINYDTVSGILYDGALHWDMKTPLTSELAIFSFNLSREEFTKTRMPAGHSVYQRRTRYTLGLMEGSLCLYVRSPSTEIWVLRRDTKSYLELLPDDYVIKYEAVYLMNEDDYSIHHDTPKLFNTRRYISAPMYVRSLVSPYQVNLMDSSSKSVVISMAKKAITGMAKKNALIKRVRRILIYCDPYLLYHHRPAATTMGVLLFFYGALIFMCAMGFFAAAILIHCDPPSVNQRN